MKTSIYINRIILDLRKKFPDASFGYFSNRQQTNHFVISENIDIYFDESFIQDQFEIINNFYDFFPNESVSFVSNDDKSLLKGLINIEPISKNSVKSEVQKWVKSAFLPKEANLESDHNQSCKTIPSASFLYNYPLAA